MNAEAKQLAMVMPEIHKLSEANQQYVYIWLKGKLKMSAHAIGTTKRYEETPKEFYHD